MTRSRSRRPTRPGQWIARIESVDELPEIHDPAHDVLMSPRRIHDTERHAHFVTFSCFKRRRMLDHDRAKRIVLGVLHSQLAQQRGLCGGFVLMPDHVHVIVWFPDDNQLSHFMKQWKQRSSVQIKRLLCTELKSYAGFMDPRDPVWQPRYYDFNIYSEKKLREKLGYMHLNPVRAGLVNRPVDWPWSSARYYELGRSVGVPVTWLLSSRGGDR